MLTEQIDIESFRGEIDHLYANEINGALTRVNNEIGLTSEMITQQCKDNWEIAIEVSYNIFTSEEPTQTLLYGEMGAGKSQILKMVKSILKVKNPDMSFTAFRNDDGRPLSRAGDIKTKKFPHENTIPWIRKELDNLELKSGDVISFTELQWYLGDIGDIHTNFQDISSLLRERYGVHVIFDCLKTFASGAPILTTHYIKHILQNSPNGSVYEPQSCNIFDNEIPVDLNMRYVQVYLDGELVFPGIDSDTGKLGRMAQAERQKLANKFNNFILENPETYKFFRVVGPHGKIKIKIPMGALDEPIIPGDIERYCAAHFQILIGALEAIEWTEDVKLYKENFEKNMEIEKQINVIIGIEG